MKISTSHTAKALIAISAAVLLMGTAGLASAQDKASAGAAAGGGVVPNTDKGGSAKSANSGNSVGAVQGTGVVTNRDKTTRKSRKAKKAAAAAS